MLLARVAVSLALALIALPVTAEVYKCPDASGKSVYQDSPCDGSVPRSVAPQPKAPAGGMSMDSLSRLSSEDRDLAMLMFFYSHCTRIFPDLHAKSAMNYQAWRLKNSAAVSRIESAPDYQVAVKRAQEEAAKN